jgi:hypothetical protein
VNALQAEYQRYRLSGLKAGRALNEMILWRMNAVALLMTGSGFVPASITRLVGELMAEAAELRGARKFAGVRS